MDEEGSARFWQMTEPGKDWPIWINDDNVYKAGVDQIGHTTIASMELEIDRFEQMTVFSLTRAIDQIGRMTISLWKQEADLFSKWGSCERSGRKPNGALTITSTKRCWPIGLGTITSTKREIDGLDEGQYRHGGAARIDFNCKQRRQLTITAACRYGSKWTAGSYQDG